MLSNIKAYVRLRAGEVGEIPRPSEFGGQATEATVDPGEQLAWRVWDCVSQSYAAYARRYARTHGKSSSESSQYATLEEALKEQGSAFTWRSAKFREVGGVLQWQSRQGEWIPVSRRRAEGARGARSGAPPTSATGTLGAHTGPDRTSWSPDPPPWDLESRAQRRNCGRSPAGGRQQPGQTTPAHRKKAPCSRGGREPARSMRPGSGPWQLTRSARAHLIQPRHWQASWQSGRKPELQRQPCGVLLPRSGPWRISSGCPQQSQPCTRGSRREPPLRAPSPICPQQAWSSWSKRPETPETGRFSARWRSSAGYVTYGWAKQQASGFLTWLCQALSSLRTSRQGRRGTPPDPCTGMRTASVRGFIATWSRWAAPQTCWSGSHGEAGLEASMAETLGDHRARPSQVACPAPGRRRSDLGPQTRPRLLQMVGQMAEHGRGDAIRHQVVRHGSRCPYGTACMVP